MWQLLNYDPSFDPGVHMYMYMLSHVKPHYKHTLTN